MTRFHFPPPLSRKTEIGKVEVIPLELKNIKIKAPPRRALHRQNRPQGKPYPTLSGSLDPWDPDREPESYHAVCVFP